jgi:hypothetical protein
VFQAGDRVSNRYVGGKPFTGTVVAVNGRWVTVKHDQAGGPVTAHNLVPDRFDYLGDELMHENVLLRLAHELSP